MDHETPPATGAVRYRTSFLINTGMLGTALDLLTKETQAPTATPSSEGRYKVVFLGTLSQTVGALVALGDVVERLAIAPEDDRPSPSLQRFAPVKPLAPYVVPAHVQVQKIPMKRRNIKGAKASERNTGRTVLSVMSQGRVYHHVDFHDVFEEQGFQLNSVSPVLGKLAEEGAIVRIGRGAYRLPTADEIAAKNTAAKDFGGASE